MKRLIIILSTLIALTACKNTEAPGYVVQVSLGGWHAPDYTSAQIIDRIDSVAQMIPVRKVIIGWSLDTSIYREVGAFLHGKGIEMLLWLPVFAETEEMCDNTPAVDLWGRIPANYDLLCKSVPGATGYPEFETDAAFLDSQLDAMAPYPCGKYPGIEINYRADVVPTSPEYVTESLEHVMAHRFDGSVLSWNIMEAPDAHIAVLGRSK